MWKMRLFASRKEGSGFRDEVKRLKHIFLIVGLSHVPEVYVQGERGSDVEGDVQGTMLQGH